MSDKTQKMIGKLLSPEMGRDAIHMAVVPMIAGMSLYPGQHIGIISGQRASTLGLPVGIVDPFLIHAVLEGERFFMFLYPNTITSLRHVWTHPAFDDSKSDVSKPDDSKTFKLSEHVKSIKWLENVAIRMDLTYAVMMEYVDSFVKDGEVATQYGSETWRNVFYRVEKEFWPHYELVRGVKVLNRDSPFFALAKDFQNDYSNQFGLDRTLPIASSG